MRRQFSTLVTNAERKILIGSLRTAAQSKEVESSSFLELGVKRADTAGYNYELLCGFTPKFSYFGIDVDPKSQIHWNRKVKRLEKSDCPAKFILSTSEEAVRLAWQPLAWVFVDACHCFECVNHDIEKWGEKVVPHGHLVLHDTTSRRMHYEKLFQHKGTRKFGVYQAAMTNEYLKENFKLLVDHDDKNGIQVYERLPSNANGDGEVPPSD